MAHTNDVIKQVQIGTKVYDIHDAQAHDLADALKIQVDALAQALVFRGIATVEITDGSTTNPQISGYDFSKVKVGDTIVYQNKEFVWGTKGSANAWIEFGDLSNLGALATKDAGYVPGQEASVSVSGTHKPTGTVSQPTFSNGAATVSGDIEASGQAVTAGLEVTNTGSTVTYTPAGIVSQPTFSNGVASVSGAISAEGTLPEMSGTLSAANLTITEAASGTATYTPAGNVSQPTLSDGKAAVPANTYVTGITSATTAVAKDKYLTNAELTNAAISVPANTYVTGVTYSAPTATTEVDVTTAVSTFVTDVAAPTTSAANFFNSASVDANGVLSFGTAQAVTGVNKPSVTTDNALISAAVSEDGATTVLTGGGVTPTKNATATALGTVGISLTKNAAESLTTTVTPAKNTAQDLTVTATISKPTFSGTGARLVGSADIPVTVSTKDEVIVTGVANLSGTATGTVSQPTFSGTGASLVVKENAPVNVTGEAELSGTATGTVSQPTFTGNNDSITLTGTATVAQKDVVFTNN